MSALPFTPLTITPRPTESPHAHSPSRREGAGGRVPDAPHPAATPIQQHALSPSQRAASEEPEAWPDSPAPLPHSSPALLPFTPSDQSAAAILDDFASQDHTLRGIAIKYDTTLESLTLWLARPDIAQRLHALESACATRARLVVANNLAAIANKLLHLLDESKLDHESIHRVPAATPHAFAARMQSRESARKTANLLLRIARYTPLPTHPTRPDAPPPAPPLPAQRGEVPESARAVRGRDAHELAISTDLPEDLTNPTRKRGAAAAHLAPQAPEDQQHRIAPPLPARRGEDRLAKGQAGEGTDAHLMAHAVQNTAAAPTTTPTRQRDVTAALLPASPSEIPALPSPERERAGLRSAESWTVARELAATPAARSAPRPATHPLAHQLSQHTREPAEAASRAPPSTPN